MSDEQKTPQESSNHQIPNSKEVKLEQGSHVPAQLETANQKPETTPPSQTSNVKSETTNMETHAHHLHKAPGHGWTHYLFEFLMLFLAVTLGFLVENWREHYVENKRERQFVTTLVEDLKSDTAQLAENILRGNSHDRMLDSLVLLLSDPIYSNSRAESYYYARSVSRPIYFFPNDRTILQLKNSGSLRLIHDLVVSDSIMYYDEQSRYLQYLSNDENEARNNFKEKAGKVFNGKIFNSMYDSLNWTAFKRPAQNPHLFSQDPALINELISATQYLKGTLRAIRMRQENLKRNAVNLISFLQKVYHLE